MSLDTSGEHFTFNPAGNGLAGRVPWDISRVESRDLLDFYVGRLKASRNALLRGYCAWRVRGWYELWGAACVASAFAGDFETDNLFHGA